MFVDTEPATLGGCNERLPWLYPEFHFILLDTYAD